MSDSIYMDYNATTPVRNEVFAVMERAMRDCFGNASSVHLPGRRSKVCVEEARRKVAESIAANTMEIVFTNGGSESDNLAIKGAAAGRTSGHIITTAIEHPAVRRSCEYLDSKGFETTYLPVAGGRLDPQAVRDAIRDDTFLITVMWANNETGHIQPVEDIAEIACEHEILFHTDAVQAFGKIPIDVKRVPVDLLSISGHKFYAPKGVGVLYIRSGIEIVPLIHGAGQEMGMRAGTENVAGIAAIGEACRLAAAEVDAESRRLAPLRDQLESAVLGCIPDTRVAGGRENRLPNTTNIAFRGVEAGHLIQALDAFAIAVSGASACASGSAKPSKALMDGVGFSLEEAIGSIRFSLGRSSTAAHIERLTGLLPGIVRELRSTSPS